MAERFRLSEIVRTRAVGARRPRRRRGRTFATFLATVLASTSVFVLAPAHPVAAQNSCFQDDPGQGANGTNWECQWTQLENSWPDNNFPSCSPCVAYGRYLTLNASINQSNVNRVAFHDDMANAVYSWSGQTYNSPWFNDCKCGSAFLNINAYHYGAGVCGEGDVSYDSSSLNIVGASADYNIDVTYVDSPNSAGTCDARSTAVHEVGHAFTEGHSSYPSDVMNWKDCMCATIDQDAQSMLNAVYGPENSSSSDSSGGGGGGGCGGCQVAPDGGGSGVGCTTVGLQTVCSTPDLAAYYWKAWYLSQGAGGQVPADPQTNPVLLITPDQCLIYYYSKQYTNWLTCTTA
jgi:hypothetical protein